MGSIARIRALVAAGERSADEIAADFRATRDRLDGRLRAIITPVDDDPAAAIPGEAAGPLSGVTFTVKDTIVVAGIRATAGSRALEDWTPTWTAPAVDRLRRAGAVLVGKASCPEFAYDLHTSNELVGRTLNPLREDLTIGGSSGGDAAAVASGMAVFGLGTDLGGSIRWPAACAGLVSLRPTPGLVPGTGQLPVPRSGGPVPRSPWSFRDRLQVVSPIARETADLWEVLRTIAGSDPLDPHSVPGSLPEPERVDLPALRIGWCPHPTQPCRRDVEEAIGRMLRSLAEVAGGVDRVSGDWIPDAVAGFADNRAREGLADLAAMVEGRTDLLGPRIRAALRAAERRHDTVDDYLEGGRALVALRARVLGLLARHPILVLPVSPVPAFPPEAAAVDVDGSELPADAVLDACRAVTAVGLPAVSVPCGATADGLPVSVQVVARPFHDHEALAVAAAIEALREA